MPLLLPGSTQAPGGALNLPLGRQPQCGQQADRGRYGRTEQSHLERMHTHYTHSTRVCLARGLGTEVVRTGRRSDQKVPPRNGLKANNK